MLEPVVPFEPVRRDTLPSDDEWIAQIKWDGVRILTYAENGMVRLFNRKQHERSRQYPELLAFSSYTAATSIILDGEVIALGRDGTPSFHQVMKRDGIRRIDRVPIVRTQMPIAYMVFDILYLNGEWLTNRPFSERMALLNETVKTSDTVQKVEQHDDASTLHAVTKAYGMEGIVLKRPDSPYLIGEKRDFWVKVKHYRDVICVVGGFTTNDSGRVNALLLGLYQDGLLIYVGHAGTGKVSDAEWREVTRTLEVVKLDTCPFADVPRRGSGATSGPPIYVPPKLTVKIQFAEWTEQHTMRQPSIQAFVDFDPQDCVME